MKRQNTTERDGMFEGNFPSVSTQAGDAPTKMQTGHYGHQTPNEYTHLKRQDTQPGWDGSFTGIPIPSPITMEGDGGGSQTSGLPAPSNSAGFMLPDEQG